MSEQRVVVFPRVRPTNGQNGSNGEKAYKRKVKYIRKIEQLENIPEQEREKLKKVAEKYVFRANDYYLDLINWEDPKDPIKQLIIPREEELNDWGKLDASNEQAITVARGVQHKYTDTVLLLCNEVCGAYCRYCFRKRLFMDENDEVTNDISARIKYISEHSANTSKGFSTTPAISRVLASQTSRATRAPATFSS